MNTLFKEKKAVSGLKESEWTNKKRNIVYSFRKKKCLINVANVDKVNVENDHMMVYWNVAELQSRKDQVSFYEEICPDRIRDNKAEFQLEIKTYLML